MKKFILPLLCFTFVALYNIKPINAQLIWQDDFESYVVDSIIDPQSTDWVGWGNTVTSALVSDDTSASGTQSLQIWEGAANGATANTSDILHLFGDSTSGRYTLKFKVYVPSNNSGTYWNIQHEVDSTNTGQEWAMEIQIMPQGQQSFIEVGGVDYFFPAVYDEWVDVVHIFDLDRDSADFFYDNKLVTSNPFSYQAGSTTGQNQLSAINLFATCGGTTCTKLGYFDDFTFSHFDDQQNDAGLLSLDIKNFCPGINPTDIYVSLRNFGFNNLNSATINWTVDGVSQTAYNYTGTLAPGEDTSVMIGSYTFGTNPSYVINAWTSNPNGVADTVNFNDTLETEIGPALSGNYTLDPSQPASSTNYQTFAAFADDLNKDGVCGPVNLTVSAGTYNEQVTFYEIEGASSTNTITIDGVDSSQAILSHDASILRPTLLLDGTDYMNIINLGIEATGSTGTALHLMNQANYNNFSNNHLSVSTTSTSSSVNVILATGSVTSTFTEGDVTNYTVFSNNLLEGGYYQVRIEGDDPNFAKGVQFLNNDFIEGYYYAFYVDNMDSLFFNNNSITSTRRSSFGDGFYATDIMNFQIHGNYIHVPDYAMYIDDANSDQTPIGRSSIVNNMLISEADYGMYLLDALKIDIFHNSVSVSGSVEAVSIDNSLTDSLDIRNNIFASESSEALYYAEPSSTLIDLDHNLYYTNGNVLIHFDGVNYADLAAFQAAYPAFNANSLEGDPQFASSDDLHIIGDFVNDKGTTTWVNEDFDGETRPMLGSTNVDIGADEFNPPSCPPVTNLQASLISTNAATLQWNGGTGYFEYEVVTAGSAQGTGTIDSTLLDSIRVSGLSPSTSYEFYVREICGPGDTSIWWASSTFETRCSVAVTYPYMHDFATLLDACWEEAGSGDPSTGPQNLGAGDWITDDYLNDASHPNGKAARVNLYSNNDEEWLITNIFDLSSAGPYELRMDAGMTDFNNTATSPMGSDDTVQVLVSTDFGGSWNVLHTWDSLNPPSNSGSKLTIDLTAYSGTDNIFAIWGTDGSIDDIEDYDFFIDNFEIRTIPSCREPSDLEVTNLTSRSASLGWTENNISIEWEVEYDTMGFALGNGTYVHTFNKPIDISSLSPNTAYEFYVRTICGRNDTSIWTGPYSFQTASELPYFEDFEDFGISGTVNQQGWYTETNSTLDWQSDDETGSIGTGPEEDHTIGAGGIFLYLEATGGSPGDYADLLSTPIYIDSNYQDIGLSFWYHKFGDDMDDLEVYIDTNGTSTLVTTIPGQTHTAQFDPWLNFSTYLTGYEGKTIQLRFRGYKGADYEGDMAIDDVEINNILPNNAGVTELINPTQLCAGTVTPIVMVKNSGGNNIDTLTVKYTINGVLDSVLYTSTILPGQTQAINLNPEIFSAGINYDFVFYTEMPNNVNDTINNDDTLKVSGMRTGLAGNYTIDTSLAVSNTNYHTFNAAINDMISYGICGPVHFDVAPATYFEQVTLSEFVGLNSTNTLTFDGGDSSMTVISHNASIVRPTLLLDGADYVTIKNFKIEATGTTATAVHLMNQANFNLISNNMLVVDTTSTSSSKNAILATQSTTSTTLEGDVMNYTTFANNLIYGGYYQVRIEGDFNNYAKGISFLNNEFKEAYLYTLFLDNMDSLVFNNNSITSRRSNTGRDGLYSTDMMNFEIEGNYINVPDYALYIDDANSDLSPVRRASITNNMLISDGDYGILLYDALDVDIYHNSVSTYGTTPAVRIDNALTDNVDIRNNVFSSENSEAFEYGVASTTVRNLDNNIYYSNGSVLVDFDGTAYADLASFQTAYPAFNIESIEGKPQFAGKYDLHMIGNLANNKGDNSVGVTVDIDGDPRPIGSDTIVDIGADEYETISCSSPIAFTVISSNTSSVSLSWSSPASEFTYEYGPQGFTQGNGTMGSVNDDTLTITGLMSGTAYDFYIRATCGPGDTSLWTGALSFSTARGLPFIEDFEDFGVHTSGIDDVEGWNSYSTSDPQWQSGTSTTSSNTGPVADHTIGTGGTFVYLETSGGTTGDNDTLYSPVIYIDSAYDNVLFEFWYHMYGATMGNLKVYADTNGTTNLITTISGQQQTAQTDPWLLYSINLLGYEGTSVQLRFVGFRGTSFTGDMAVDDVSLLPIVPLNANLNEIVSENIDHCNASYVPTLAIQNMGTDTIQNIKVVRDINGIIDTTLLTDTILPDQIDQVSLSSAILNFGSNNITYYVIEPNGGQDQVTNGDTIHTILFMDSITAGTIAGRDTICFGDTVELSAESSVGDLQWQELINGTWTDISGADSVSISVSPGNNSSYRVVACDTSFSDTLNLEVISVSTPTTNGDSAIVYCGNSADLHLEAFSTNSNAQFEWYETEFGGSPLSSGSNVTISSDGDSLSYTATPAGMNSPVIDTFYVTEVVGGGTTNNPILIVEMDLGGTDVFEIQNVSSSNEDVTGWTVAVSDSYTNINTHKYISLSGTMNVGDIRTWSDGSVGTAWGSNIFWNPGSPGWIMILDDNGEIVDVLFSNWDELDIQGMSTTINGHTVAITNEWTGDGVDGTNAGTGSSIQRQGNEDHNDSTDFTIQSTSHTQTNSGLSVPFKGGNCYSPSRAMVIGMVECTPVPDLALNSFVSPTSSNNCYSNAEDVEVLLINPLGRREIDFTVDTFDIVVNVSGSANQTLTYQLNDNSLNGGLALQADDSLNINLGTLDMTNVGTYNFQAYLSSNIDTVNTNDTINTSIINSTSGGSLSGLDSICGSDFVTLSTSGSMGDLQWQRLVGSSFVNESGADSSSYEVFVDSTTTFRVVACGTEYSDTITVESIDIPAAPSTTNDTVNTMCGLSGNAVLTATNSTSGTLNWYDAATGGSLITTGDTLLNNYSSGTQSAAMSYADTFYVSESYLGCEGPRSMAIAIINIETPAAPAAVHDTAYVFCGDSGTAIITAISQNSSESLKWYDSMNGGTLLSTNDTLYYGLSTSPQPATTTYSDTFYVVSVDSLSNCESPRTMVSAAVVCTVGEEEMQSSLKGINIQPNPSRGIFYLIGNNVETELNVSIYNSNGKMVYNMENKVKNSFNKQIDLSGLAKGIYFVKLQGKESMEVRKIVIH